MWWVSPLHPSFVVCVSSLGSENPLSQISSSPQHNRYPIIIAAMEGYLEIVRLLLECDPYCGVEANEVSWYVFDIVLMVMWGDSFCCFPTSLLWFCISLRIILSPFVSLLNLRMATVPSTLLSETVTWKWFVFYYSFIPTVFLGIMRYVGLYSFVFRCI